MHPGNHRITSSNHQYVWSSFYLLPFVSPWGIQSLLKYTLCFVGFSSVPITMCCIASTIMEWNRSKNDCMTRTYLKENGEHSHHHHHCHKYVGWVIWWTGYRSARFSVHVQCNILDRIQHRNHRTYDIRVGWIATNFRFGNRASYFRFILSTQSRSGSIRCEIGGEYRHNSDQYVVHSIVCEQDNAQTEHPQE